MEAVRNRGLLGILGNFNTDPLQIWSHFIKSPFCKSCINALELQELGVSWGKPEKKVFACVWHELFFQGVFQKNYEPGGQLF
jgi:hypothetical protein